VDLGQLPVVERGQQVGPLAGALRDELAEVLERRRSVAILPIGPWWRQ
jgi:hypothetical protein